MAISADLDAIRAGALSVQEQVLRGDHLDPWRVAVACICVKRTNGDRASPFVHTLMSIFPTPKRMLCDAIPGTLATILYPLGLATIREDAMLAATTAFHEDPAGMWDIVGPYTRDSIRLIVGRKIDPAPSEKVLKAVRDRMLSRLTGCGTICYPLGRRK